MRADRPSTPTTVSGIVSRSSRCTLLALGYRRRRRSPADLPLQHWIRNKRFRDFAFCSLGVGLGLGVGVGVGVGVRAPMSAHALAHLRLLFSMRTFGRVSAFGAHVY